MDKKMNLRSVAKSRRDDILLTVGFNLRIVTCILLFLLYACKEDEKGQYPVSSVAPGKVTSAKVVDNFAGGAVIVYDVPSNENALYVRARYTLDDGTPMELKASVYTNSITIVGIGRSRELPVVLTVVDRSRNESEPETVMAYPLDSPIYELADLMDVRADFGGIALRWENPEKVPIVIDIYSPDDDDRMYLIDRFYSQTQVGKVNIRGHEAKETIFSVAVRDRWGNATEPKTDSYIPLFEEKIDKSKFRRWNPPGLPYQPWEGNASYQIERLWDDEWHPSIYCAASYSNYLTFDMGQLAKISRFKIYQEGRDERLYNLNSPKRFELWGSATPNVSADFNTWQFLGYWESHKPSGLPLGQTTDEDLQYAAIDGEDFDVEDSPYVRYIRFNSIETWGQGNRLYMMEMTFWGIVQE